MAQVTVSIFSVAVGVKLPDATCYETSSGRVAMLITVLLPNGTVILTFPLFTYPSLHFTSVAHMSCHQIRNPRIKCQRRCDKTRVSSRHVCSSLSYRRNTDRPTIDDLGRVLSRARGGTEKDPISCVT